MVLCGGGRRPNDANDDCYDAWINVSVDAVPKYSLANLYFTINILFFLPIRKFLKFDAKQVYIW